MTLAPRPPRQPGCLSHNPQPTIHNPAREAGFAMLLVFALAAAVAILLYMELPRVAFEAQRAREQFLIDRGEQYQRAIQLFFRKTRTYPTTLEQLESTNNIRFLRHRYKDPMTGKDEWRIIHMGPGGMLTDSLVQKPPGLKPDEKDKDKASASTGTAATPAAPGQPGAEGPLAAIRRRPSELPGTSPSPAQPGEETYTQPPPTPPYTPDPSDPNAQPAQPYPYPFQQPAQAVQAQPYTYPQVQPGQVQPYTYPQVQPGQIQPYTDPQAQAVQIQPYPYPQAQPGQPQPYLPSVQPFPSSYPQVQPNQPQVLPYLQVQPAQSFPGAQIFPGQVPPGYPAAGVFRAGGPFGRPGIAQPVVGGAMVGGVSIGGVYPQNPQASPYGGAPPPFSPYTPSSPARPAPNANPALDMIQRILTTPRPGGLTPTQGQSTFTIGGGIAGVATTLEAEGIKVYNERTKYNEWEFVYDFRKDRSMLRPGTPTSPPGLLLQTPQQMQSPMTPMQPNLIQPGTFGRGR